MAVVTENPAGSTPTKVQAVSSTSTGNAIQALPSITKVATVAIGTVVPPNIGPQGIQGERGPAGTGDLTYDHFQATASNIWVVIHGLGKKPSVVVIDSSGSECEGTVTYDSINQVTITFSAAFGGHAYIN